MIIKEQSIKHDIFPMGAPNDVYAKYFVGQRYLNNLISDLTINVSVGNVTFEPGCRNNWHIHHDGVKHWHGATKGSWFSHIAITASIPEWLE